MHFKKLKYLLLISLCSFTLISCGKKEASSDLNLPTEQSSSVVEETSEDTSEEKKDEDSESKEEMDAVVKKEDISKAENYKAQAEEYNKLFKFYKQLKLLVEDDMLANYNQNPLGANIDDVVASLDTANLRYINNVTLKTLYDESHQALDMKDRKGLIVFSSSNLSEEEETGRLCNKDNYKASLAEKIEIDVNGCDFDSFVVYTFNDEGVLIGKFKYLLTEENSEKVNVGILSGDLTFTDSFELKMEETASSKDVYEKIDAVKTLMEEYQKEMDLSFKQSFNDFKSVYDGLSENTTGNDLAKKVEEVDLNIEKMPASAITKFNQKYLNNYQDGYYISMSIDDNYTSPDMRYNNNYIIVIMNDDDKIWYKQIISSEYNDIVCKDELNADDYSLVELNKAIADYEEKIESLKQDKSAFYTYYEENLNLLNTKLNFDMTKSEILSEVDKSGLECDEDYQNLIITTVRDRENANLELTDKYGESIYDSCIKITDTERSIYYFFKDGKVIGVYRSEFFDAGTVSIKDYYNLGSIKKGMDQVVEKETTYKQQQQMYINMVNKKLSDFIDTIGYDSNHKDNQIYRKQDVIKALSMNGFRYEEGMNKGDGLYYIGIFALDNDTKYAYKIYFNTNEGVELIQ